MRKPLDQRNERNLQNQCDGRWWDQWCPRLSDRKCRNHDGEGTDVAMDVADIVLMKMICCAWSTVTVWLKITADHQTKHRLFYQCHLVADCFKLPWISHAASRGRGSWRKHDLSYLKRVAYAFAITQRNTHQAKPTRKDCDDCILYQQSLHTWSPLALENARCWHFTRSPSAGVLLFFPIYAWLASCSV